MEGQLMDFYDGLEGMISIDVKEYERDHPKWNGRFEPGDMVEINGVFMIVDSVQPATEDSSLTILLKESY